MAYRDMGRMDRALRGFDAAIELEERFGLAFYARGITKVNLGAHEAALGDFDAVLGLDPDNASAFRGRGVALGSLGRFDEAVRDFDRSLELEPGNGEALAARGLAHSSLERHELAIEDYSRVIDLDPRNRDVLYSRGIARMHVARFESAIEDFEAILGIEPGHAAATCSTWRASRRASCRSPPRLRRWRSWWTRPETTGVNRSVKVGAESESTCWDIGIRNLYPFPVDIAVCLLVLQRRHGEKVGLSSLKSLSHKPGSVSDIVNMSHLVAITDSNLCVLRQLASSL